MRPSALLGFALHGTTLALAWFFLVNVVMSAAVAIAATALARRATRMSSGFWFALRILPAAAAGLFVAAMFLPSYWKYEPVETVEGFDVTLTVCGAAAIVVVTAACMRAIGAWRSASVRTRAWMRTARPLQLPGSTLPAFEVATETPLMALVGIVRPRLLVTRGLIDALTPEELAASVAHEIGHSRGRDNLKRLMMRAAPDVFTSSAAARTLELLCAASAEHRADQIGSGADPSLRCALASALVKVARLRPSSTPIAEPISTLLGGGDIASRVRSLLDAAPATDCSRRMGPLVAVVSIIAAIAAYAPLLVAVHEATETLVRLLP